MADTLTGRASHRLLDQQSLPRPFGALGETIPQRPGDAGHNVPANFHRRSLGESGMLAYTEHAQNVNHRRYQYPQGYASNKIITSNGMGRKWASLPKLSHQREPQKDEGPTYINSKGEFRRPQSDIIHHESLSRPNTPVRPASETIDLPHLSPRIRMRDYRHYIERTQRRPNILSLSEEEAANAFYEDDFETEDSGVEPELKDIQETPVESALNDLNQPNRNIEITPFPALVELNTQQAVIHSPSKAKPQMRNTKQVTENGVWTKKGKTRNVKVTVNNNTNGSIKVLPDYPLTTVASDSRRDPGTHRSPVLSPRKPTQYSKQMSESVHFTSPDVSSRSPSFELDFNEVIIPGVDQEDQDYEVVPGPEDKQHHQGAIPKHPPIIKELMTNKNIPNQNHPASVKLQKTQQSSSPTKELKLSQPPTSPTKEAKPKQPSPTKDLKSPQAPSPTKEPKASPKPPPQSPTKSEKAKGQNVNSEKAGLTSNSAEELSDIAVTGSKVSSKPVPANKESKPKKPNPTQPVTRKPTPAQKPKPAKPAIRIPTGSSKSTDATPTSTTDLEKTGSSKTKAKKEDPKAKEPKEELEEEDSLPELRGVLKGKGDGSKKGKKKSVQFGPKFVREVTKITYPWNEVDSDSEDDSDEDEDEDDDSDIAEEIEEELDTLISMQKEKDEIDKVGAENKTTNGAQKTDKGKKSESVV